MTKLYDSVAVASCLHLLNKEKKKRKETLHSSKKFSARFVLNLRTLEDPLETQNGYNYFLHKNQHKLRIHAQLSVSSTQTIRYSNCTWYCFIRNWEVPASWVHPKYTNAHSCLGLTLGRWQNTEVSFHRCSPASSRLVDSRDLKVHVFYSLHIPCNYY